jgi:putative photosynthetic complex assembly protein
MPAIHSREAVPRPAALALGTLLIVCLIGVGIVRFTGVNIREADAPTAAERSLRFEDGPAGSVTVIDAKTGQTIDSVTGEAGFLRGSLRALVRERKMRGIDSGPPFQLILRTDGRLTLFDPTTKERLDLESFGPTNIAVYRRWIPLESPGSRSSYASPDSHATAPVSK